MTYCTDDDVRSIVVTGLTNPQIGALIVLVDAEIDLRLGGATLSSDLKKLCSMLKTAVLAAERDPETYAIGSARVTYGKRVQDWAARAETIITQAVRGTRGVRMSYYDHADDEVKSLP